MGLSLSGPQVVDVYIEVIALIADDRMLVAELTKRGRGGIPLEPIRLVDPGSRTDRVVDHDLEDRGLPICIQRDGEHFARSRLEVLVPHPWTVAPSIQKGD